MINSDDTQKIMSTALAVSSVIPHKKTRAYARTGVAVVSTGMGVYSLLKEYKNRIQSRKYSYSLSISSMEPAFTFVYKQFEQYLRQSPEINKKQSVAIESYYDSNDDFVQDIVYTSDKEFEVEFVWNGIPIIYQVAENRPMGNQPAARLTRTAVISCSSADEMNRIKERITEITRDAIDRTTSVESGSVVFRLSPNMEFSLDTTRRHVRPMDTVVVEKKTRDKIDQHISTFIQHEDEYSRVSIPYHTGILLYGPPGTGKTSLVSALGAEYDMDTYIISLKMLESDADLITLSRHIRPRSIVLLEDIDTIAPKRQGQDKTKISLDAFLNFLDGLSTPYGMVAVMTANDKDALDDALIRPGRMDVSAKIGYFTEDMVLEFCAKFVSDDEGFLGDVQEIVVGNMDTSTHLTGAEMTMPIKEAMFLDTEGRKEYMISFLEERINK